MTWNYMSVSTVFQSYQDDGLVIIKGSVQWNPVYIEKISASGGLEPRMAISVGQLLSH